METNTYVIPEDRREEVEKLVQKLQRKAEKYGNRLEVSMSKPHAAEVNYWEEDSFGEQRIVHTDLVEAFDLTITSDIVRNGNYQVIAMLEHLDGGNVVTTFGETEVKNAWRKAGCRCDHCKTNRDRKLTFIVFDGNTEKQVGKTCLKDYCGIDPNGIGINNELRDVFLDYDINEIREYDPDRPVISRAYSALEVLALAIRTSKKQGYVKSEYPNSNKEVMSRSYNMYHNLINPITPAERAEAEAMANGIMDIPENDLHYQCCVLSNVKAMLESHYCKASHFGYLAYAPIDYAKYQQKMEKQRQREAGLEAMKSSEYVGEIGKRQVFDISHFELVTSWETDYGMTYLYRFLTTNGDVLIWKASSVFGEWVTKDNGCMDFVEHKAVNRIKATVKDHNERDGIKQTVITRCKIA